MSRILAGTSNPRTVDLEEEHGADEKLTRLAMTAINVAASTEA